MYESRCSMPTIIEGNLGRPIMVGNIERGHGSSERPALVRAVPGSIIMDSTDIMINSILLGS